MLAEIRELDDSRALDTAAHNALEAWWYIWQHGSREEETDAHEQLARVCESFFTLKGGINVTERE
jgi:hypothetical protein